MVILESSGFARFIVDDVDATTIMLVGNFSGYFDDYLQMHRVSQCRWERTVQLGSGEHLFAYLIDGCDWRIDRQAHGLQTLSDGRVRSRLWCPPATMDADAIAA